MSNHRFLGREVGIDQVAEPLELIHDDEVGFECVETYLREDSAKRVDDANHVGIDPLRVGSNADEVVNEGRG